jgi:hypothetical protein
MKMKSFALLLIVLASTALAGEAPAKFTQKPTATKAGGKTKITFAVDRATDVAVFIEDGNGEVVRHLVAGVLGKRPPKPLKPGLSQSIEWDGKADYGKPAGSGPFKVRVALGLGAKYDKVLAEDRQNFGNVKSLAVGPDGTLYICSSFGAQVPNWGGELITAVDRAGKYLRTVAPYPVSLEKEKVAGFGTVEIGGRTSPLWKSIARRSFYAGDVARKAGMAVTKDGVILKLIGGYRGRGPMSIAAIGVRGDCPWGKDAGPVLLKLRRPQFGRAFVCVSSDGKYAYVSGMRDVTSKKDFAAVYRVKLPERTPCQPFFGKPDAAGKGSGQLGAKPRGVATDGKGHLFICDFSNDRVVVVDEQSGKQLGEFAVKRPDSIGVDGKTGAVYVSRAAGRGSMELVKYSGWKNAQELVKLPVKGEGNPDYPWVMALDAGAQPPIIWMGSDRGSVLRIEDRGGKFVSKKINTGGYQNGAFVDLNVDRFRKDKEIYWRCGRHNWYRYDEKSGKFGRIRLPLSGAAGSCLNVGPDGYLYAAAYSQHLLRFTRDGKPAPWKDGSYPKEYLGKTGKIGKIKPGPKHGTFLPVSMTYMTHTVGITHDNRIFAFEPGHPGGRPPKMLIEYLPSGKRVGKPIIWKVSDTAIGPKFDQAGNIYIAEQVKPLDQPYPPEFKGVVGPVTPSKSYLNGVKDQICTMYGSILKFSPKGGMVHFKGEDPFGKQTPKLNGLKSVEAGSYHGHRFKPTKVTGALWMKMGISHVDLFYCNCENTRFDVDLFGRVWYPDTGRFRVAVLDTDGNELTHFGGYGNADSRGPESKDKKLAQPDIAFGWLIGVGATDKYVYMGDSMNKRMLRAKITYAAEATCAIK